MMKEEKIQYPRFSKIIKECREKIKKKFIEHGNSWNNIFIGDKFWRNRLQTEINEIWSAENRCEQKKEIVDAINILAMMYEKCDYECKEEDKIYKRTWRYG